MATRRGRNGICSPPRIRTPPCFVFIHGGYWQRNTREEFCALGAGLRAHGWSLAFPGYTLAPEATMTQIAGEIIAALDHLAADGPARGIAGPVLLSGWSAGGHLTAMGLEHPLVTAGLGISGIYELGPVRDTYLDTALKLTDEEIEVLSPLRLPVVQEAAHLGLWDGRIAAFGQRQPRPERNARRGPCPGRATANRRRQPLHHRQAVAGPAFDPGPGRVGFDGVGQQRFRRLRPSPGFACCVRVASPPPTRPGAARPRCGHRSGTRSTPNWPPDGATPGR